MQDTKFRSETARPARRTRVLLDDEAIAKQAEEYIRLLTETDVPAKKMAEMIRFLKTHRATWKDWKHD